MGIKVSIPPTIISRQCAPDKKEVFTYAVASEDMDSLTFRASRFLRHLMEEFDVSKVLEELNLTMDQFIDLCVLSGCLFLTFHSLYLAKRFLFCARKLIRQHGSIENILENINKERYQIPENWPYQEARRLISVKYIKPVRINENRIKLINIISEMTRTIYVHFKPVKKMNKTMKNVITDKKKG
ncbi:hypothetical protein ACJIZ3_014235 [Penstemon smallii]|uniref:XPG-I domain-containing protein n=1 Tax=Penstemon smallii TaxID=265156 RepID=A0ABD3RIY2_9LAMI